MSALAQGGARRVERVDRHETVVGLERERGDVLFPVLVPRGPAVQAGRDLRERHGG